MFETLIWLVPVAVAATGLWRPRWGIYLFLACLPLFGSPPGGPYLGALDLCALAILMASFRAEPATPSRVDRPALAFVLVSAASLLPLAYQPPGWRPGLLLDLLAAFPGVQRWTTLFTWRALADLLLGWGLFISVRRAFAGASPRRPGVALGVGLLPLLILGLVEKVGWIDLGGYRPIGADHFETRLHSLFFHPGWLAEVVVLAAPLAVAALLLGSRTSRAAGLLLAALAPVTLLLTEQRGAWFTLLAQVVLLAALALGRFSPDRRRLAWRMAGTAGVAALLLAALLVLRPGALSPIVERLREAVSDLSGRPTVWEAAAEMTAERPLLGQGLGSFTSAWELSNPVKRTQRFAWLTAHNHYLMLSAERGLFGLGAAALVAWAALVALRRRLSTDREARLLATGLLVGICGFLVYGSVQYFFFLRAIEWLCWVLLACVALLSPRSSRSRVDRAAVILMILALLVAGARAAVRSAPPGSGNRSFGFHRPEKASSGGAFEWTAGRAARRLDWRGEVLVLRFANGHPRGAERPVEVKVEIDGREVLSTAVVGGWEEHRLSLGPPMRESIVLEISAEPTFRPFSDFRRYPELPPSRDIRSLGIAVARPRWE